MTQIDKTFWNSNDSVQKAVNLTIPWKIEGKWLGLNLQIKNSPLLLPVGWFEIDLPNYLHTAWFLVKRACPNSYNVYYCSLLSSEYYSGSLLINKKIRLMNHYLGDLQLECLFNGFISFWNTSHWFTLIHTTLKQEISKWCPNTIHDPYNDFVDMKHWNP